MKKVVFVTMAFMAGIWMAPANSHATDTLIPDDELDLALVCADYWGPIYGHAKAQGKLEERHTALKVIGDKAVQHALEIAKQRNLNSSALPTRASKLVNAIDPKLRADQKNFTKFLQTCARKYQVTLTGAFAQLN